MGKYPNKLTTLKKFNEGVIRCRCCKKVKNKDEFDENPQFKVKNLVIPYKQICKECSDEVIQNTRDKKEKELKDKWLGYETDIFKVTKFIGYFSKETRTEEYPRWWFEYECKYCKNTEIVEPFKLSELKKRKTCYLCRCSIKVDENLKKCSCCGEWFPNTEDYYSFFDSCKGRGGESNYYCHICNGEKRKKVRKKRSENGKEREYRETIKTRVNDRSRERYQDDPEFKMKLIIRNHVNRITKIKKSNEHTTDLIGCDWDFFKNHIESQFYGGMTWENHGDIWHYDHVVPLALAKGEVKFLRKLAKWWNLSPAFGKENGDKNCQVPYISTQSKQINELIEKIYDEKQEYKFLPLHFRIDNPTTLLSNT